MCHCPVRRQMHLVRGRTLPGGVCAQLRGNPAAKFLKFSGRAAGPSEGHRRIPPLRAAIGGRCGQQLAVAECNRKIASVACQRITLYSIRFVSLFVAAFL
jgi:hypothetical protein